MKPPTRFVSFFGATILAVVAWVLPAIAAAPSTRPNIVFIMVDEMRWDALTCAGHPFVRTPHLDALAREGTRFAAAYTCAPVCVPSRYSFFSSRYAHVHGSLGNEMRAHDGEVFLPDLLRHYGYETAISGKLHFLPKNRAYGFDYFWSFGDEGPHQLQTWPEFLEKKYTAAQRKLVDQPYPDDPLGKDIGRLTYAKEDQQCFWITDRAVDFLHERDQAKPFFLFVSYYDPHSPSHLTEPYWSMYDAKDMPEPHIPAAVKRERAAALADGAKGPGPARSLIDNEDMARQLTAKYFAKVNMVDDNVGRLLAEVRKLGLDDNTIVVFTSDHGNMLADRGRWFKSVMYEGSSRIPLIIKAPPGSPFAADFNRGRTVAEIVESIDVMPTLMEMIGRPIDGQPGFQGQSLARVAAGRDPQWKNTAFAELVGPQMVRTGEFKLIKNAARRVATEGGAYELYDMKRDPKEEHDLADNPAHAKVLGELKAKLEAWQHIAPPPPDLATLAAVPSAR